MRGATMLCCGVWLPKIGLRKQLL
uniref:Uncharacterized protein n=1 Tax=Arundo donax TaxID=35708 RepID=A0A0A9AV17_ARUDO